MSLIVENESQLAVHVKDTDPIAVGCEEDLAPTMDECRAVQEQRRNFIRQMDFSDASGMQDDQRIVESDRKKTSRSW